MGPAGAVCSRRKFGPAGGLDGRDRFLGSGQRLETLTLAAALGAERACLRLTVLATRLQTEVLQTQRRRGRTCGDAVGHAVTESLLGRNDGQVGGSGRRSGGVGVGIATGARVWSAGGGSSSSRGRGSGSGIGVGVGGGGGNGIGVAGRRIMMRRFPAWCRRLVEGWRRYDDGISRAVPI